MKLCQRESLVKKIDKKRNFCSGNSNFLVRKTRREQGSEFFICSNRILQFSLRPYLPSLHFLSSFISRTRLIFIFSLIYCEKILRLHFLQPFEPLWNLSFFFYFDFSIISFLEQTKNLQSQKYLFSAERLRISRCQFFPKFPTPRRTRPIFFKILTTDLTTLKNVQKKKMFIKFSV